MRATLRLAKNLRRSIELGHPWLYDRALAAPPRPLAPGELVDVADDRGKIAVGYADPGSPIRVRVLAVGERAPLSPGWIGERARRAAAIRAVHPQLRDTDAVRAIHGEADAMPGLVVDVYAGTAVVVFDGDAARAVYRPALAEVRDGIVAAGIAVDRVFVRDDGATLGAPPPELIEIREGAARFGVDVRRGQKTGLFLDQRASRRRVAQLCTGGDVLNLFGYTGGFSVHAALAGARRVTTVDIAAPAIAAARDNFARSGIDPARHRFEVADVFDLLRRPGERHDVVICDPPSLAPSERTRARGLVAYRKLNLAAAAAVRPGGLLVTASCSSHVSEADFVDMLAALPGLPRIVELRGADGDHPVAPAFPEGRYLKLAIVALTPASSE